MSEGSLRLIERKDLEEKQWEALVLRSGAAVYNRLLYLDTLAEDWCALVYGTYRGAIAVPYTTRLGVKGVFTPSFIRALDWMGELPADFSVVESLLQQHFKRGDLNTNQLLFASSNELCYQRFADVGEVALGSQTKRGIKKFEKTGLCIEACSIEQAFPLVVAELKEKVKTLQTIDFIRFEQLLLKYPSDEIACFVVKGERIHAAIILIYWNGEAMYIKGAVDSFGKQHGVMHALMADAIQQSFNRGFTFSFEGSFVPSVRQFNLGFGAKDTTYYSWKWDRSPWWFRCLLKAKKRC